MNTFAQYDLFKPVIDSIVKKNGSGPSAPSHVTAMVNPDTAPLSMSSPSREYPVGNFSFNNYVG